MQSDGKFRCPSCSGLDIRKSLPKGALDSIMLLFSRKPFRCRRCERRFYSTHELVTREETATQAHADQHAG